MIASRQRCIRVALWTTGLALGLVSGCRGHSNDKDQTPTQTTETTAAEQEKTTQQTPANKPPPLAPEDREFATKAAQGGMEEVAMGHAVEPKATAPVVKTFAAHMVADHGKADAELKALMVSKSVTLPTDLGAEQRKNVDEMAALSGPQLDKRYADDMVEDHEQDVKEFKEAEQKVKDPELRAWIKKTLPTLEHHLAMAKEMQANVRH
ncbi:DUF4142 domain-containing protein [Labilithrix luteola]|nr:DUF4142 domain-containing protein [Labilithrix luteola]